MRGARDADAHWLPSPFSATSCGLSGPPPAHLLTCLCHRLHVLQLPPCPFVSTVSINVFEVLKDGPVLVAAGLLPRLTSGSAGRTGPCSSLNAHEAGAVQLCGAERAHDSDPTPSLLSRAPVRCSFPAIPVGGFPFLLSKVFLFGQCVRGASKHRFYHLTAEF